MLLRICRLCNKTFTMKQKQGLHWTQELFKKNKPLKCNHSNATFLSVSTFSSGSTSGSKCNSAWDSSMKRAREGTFLKLLCRGAPALSAISQDKNLQLVTWGCLPSWQESDPGVKISENHILRVYKVYGKYILWKKKKTNKLISRFFCSEINIF